MTTKSLVDSNFIASLTTIDIFREAYFNHALGSVSALFHVKPPWIQSVHPKRRLNFSRLSHSQTPQTPPGVPHHSLTPWCYHPCSFLCHPDLGSTAFFSFPFTAPLSGMDKGRPGQEFFKVLACSGLPKPLYILLPPSQVHIDVDKSQFPKGSKNHFLARIKPDHLSAPLAFHAMPCSI